MNYKNLKIYQPQMEYRRFGKTNKKLSVITMGGMRFKHGWDDPREQIPSDTLKECVDSVQQAFAAGINHIETAYGYKKSEHAFGLALNDELNIKRDSYYLMTKGSAKTAGDMRRMVDNQLKALKTDYFDFYGWHGINNQKLFDIACAKKGPV
ncbi:MAG: aldo/keto reductase, partial [Bacteroidales bacterium]|nr:aldo/keto reductase [Bacteroidales bacterium]